MTFVVRVGDLIDALAASLRALPRHLWRALSVRRYRRAAIGAALLYMLVYLVAIQDLDISTAGRFSRFADIPSAQVVPDWQDKVFAQRAPYLYEPVGVVYLLPQLAWFISVGNILIAAALALPLGLSVALALYSVATAKACGRFAYSGLFAVLPTFLLGFGCCAPTIILLLGTGVAATLVPVRSYLFPLALASMGVMFVWMAWRLRTYDEKQLLQRAPTG